MATPVYKTNEEYEKEWINRRMLNETLSESLKGITELQKHHGCIINLILEHLGLEVFSGTELRKKYKSKVTN